MKKLVRIEEGRVLGGGCAGIAKYYGEDVTWIRILAIILFLVHIGFWAYVIGWLVIPSEDEAR